MPRTRNSTPRGLGTSDHRSDFAGGGGAGHYEPDAGQRGGAVDASRNRPPPGGRQSAAARRVAQKPGSAGMPSPPRLDTDRARHIHLGGSWAISASTARGVRAAPGRSWSPPRSPGRPDKFEDVEMLEVCGRGPSSAATISSTRSIDRIPASMLGRNRSCPAHKAQLGAVRQGRRRSRGRSSARGAFLRAAAGTPGAPARSCRGRYGRRRRIMPHQLSCPANKLASSSRQRRSRMTAGLIRPITGTGSAQPLCQRPTAPPRLLQRQAPARRSAAVKPAACRRRSGLRPGNATLAVPPSAR